MNTRSDTRKWTTLAVAGLGLAVVVAGGLAFRAAWKAASDQNPLENAGAPKSKTATPATVEAILQSAHAYTQRGEAQTAETVLAAATSQYPEVQELHLAYADILLNRSKMEDAYAEYERALAIGPRTPTLEFTAGNAANMAGKPERALEHFAAAQTADPAHAEYPLYLAQIQIKLGQTEPAKVALLRAARLDPDNAFSWGTLGEISLRENNLELCLQHIAKARKLEPSSVPWRLIEARALKRSGQPQKALDLLIGLPDADRFQGPVLNQIAECCGMLGKPAAAATLFGKASDASPGDPDLALSAAQWFERAGDKEEALAFAKRAARLGSDSGEKLVKRLAEGS